jgi:hypothetical protein
MEFEEISGAVTITFDMGTLEAMARACRAAAMSAISGTLKDPYPFDVAACAFTAAAMIARTHGDMPKEMTERLASIHKRLMDD